MKSLNETIKSTNNCEHSIKLLTDIILGIEAYPELHKTLEISKNIDKELNEYLEKIILKLWQKKEPIMTNNY